MGASSSGWQNCGWLAWFADDGQALEDGCSLEPAAADAPERHAVIAAAGSTVAHEEEEQQKGAWCAATVGYGYRTSLDVVLTSGDGTTRAARALGRCVGACLAKHSLTANDLLSLRLVTDCPDELVTCEVRGKLLEAIYRDSESPYPPSHPPPLRAPLSAAAHTHTGDLTGHQGVRQATLMTVPKVCLVRGAAGHEQTVEMLFLVEIVAARCDR